MRNLKKVLSMVLVVAMIASMLVVGAAAAETVETTNYKEAASVVIGLEIIEGDENGYNFAGNLTREQAAKIIAYMLLGKDTAETLKVSTAPFADVAATRWSAPYIAYLKNQGIVSGVSDTEFDPTANVTGIALAKMMLTAVGYGANGEFEGAAWDINTITFANDNGVFDGTLAAELDAPATREEAMLYMFNTLTKVPTVKWNATFESYYTGKSALDILDGEFDPTDPDAFENPYAYTLGWTKYELSQENEGHDAFGRPSASWIADGVIVAEDVAVAQPIDILYGGVDGGEIYDTLGKTIAESLNKADKTKETYSTITVWVDGDPDAIVIDPTVDPIKAGYTTNDLFENSGNGATVEFYASYEDGAYTVDVVVWYEHVATVTSVKKTAGSIMLNGTIEVSGEDFDISGYAKNDVVAYTLGANGDGTVASIRELEPVVGTYINNTLFTYNIDGVTANASEVADTASLPALGDKNTQFEFYYDAQGCLLKAEPYDAASASGNYNFLYVVSASSQIEDEGDLYTSTETNIIMKVVYGNGGKDTVNYNIKTTASGEEYITFDGEKVFLAASTEQNKDGSYKVEDKDTGAINAGITSGWYSYTANDDGEVTLKKITSNKYATESNYIEVENDKAGIYTVEDAAATFTANSKTVINLVDSKGVVTTFSGIANFPEEDELAGEFATVITHAKTGSANDELAKNIYVYIDEDSIGGADEYVYVIMAWSYDDETVTYWVYQDGASTFITANREDITGPYNAAFGGYYLAGMEEFIMSAVLEIDMIDGEPVLTYAPTMQNGANTTDDNTGAVLWYEYATIDTVDDSYFTTVEIDFDGAWDYTVAETKTVPTEEGEYVHPMTNTVWFDVYGDNDWTTLTGFENDYEVVGNQAEMDAAAKNNAELIADSGCIYAGEVASIIYYYDGNTVIYDCVNGGFAEELSVGDNFIAVYDADNYCEYIWIVA